jgi:ABC-type multidrug transport system ATPase subunit
MLEAQQLAHCVGILERGQLLDQDSPGELCRRHLDQELETSSAQPSLEKVYRKLTGNSLTQFGS